VYSLEECEALCSRLAIMVAGQLRCLGTAQQLKARYSQGYTVTVRVTSGDEPDKLATLDRYISSLLHDRCSLHSRHVSSACYSVTCDVPCSRLFAVMEAARTSIAVADYTVTQTTLEQVFVALVSETR
jgi:ABC-type multidrug transport system ATPase subunit